MQKTDIAKPLAVLTLTVVTLLICLLVPEPTGGGAAGVVMELPYHVGPLYAFSQEITKAEHDILPPDTTFARKAYGTTSSDPLDRITCSIVLSGREKRSIHRPERCLPSQGWRIDGSQVITVPLESGHSLDVMALEMEHPVLFKDGRSTSLKSHFLYWFVAQDATTPYQFERILLTNWDLLFHRETKRWAYVFVQGYVTEGLEPNGTTSTQVLDRLKQFIHDSVPYYVKSEMSPEMEKQVSAAELSR